MQAGLLAEDQVEAQVGVQVRAQAKVQGWVLVLGQVEVYFLSLEI